MHALRHLTFDLVFYSIYLDQYRVVGEKPTVRTKMTIVVVVIIGLY